MLNEQEIAIMMLTLDYLFSLFVQAIAILKFSSKEYPPPKIT